MVKKSNPNGANQYLLDPRQKLCWELYITPETDYFGNAYQSAVKAGYEEKTALRITTADWFVEKVRRLNLLGKAEKVLNKTLDYETEADGKVQTDLLRVQTDVAKFIAKTQGKNEGYSERTELTGKDGESLISPEAKEKADEAINSYLNEKYPRNIKEGG
jgi:hypothetical protein